MSFCLCYHDEQNFLHERGVCYGTKEKEPCSCGGNPVMCDFYEEVREKYLHRTNADLIRHSADEELADMFWELLTDSQFKNPYREKAELLDWLKAPVGKEVGE